MFLTRPLFDRLLQARPAFMAASYPKLRRAWSLAGVSVSGNPEILATLRSYVDALGT